MLNPCSGEMPHRPVQFCNSRPASRHHKTLDAEIRSVDTRADGKQLISLQNGQHWEQIDGRPLHLVPGDPVRIRKAAFGSYLLYRAVRWTQHPRTPDRLNMSDCKPAPSGNLEPSAWVLRFLHLIPAGGRVLDLACGKGRHTRLLADRGHPVTAVDIDVSGIADLAQRPAHREYVQIDLETGAQPFSSEQFAAVIVCNYLHRPHFAWLADILLPGGVLLMETFARATKFMVGHAIRIFCWHPVNCCLPSAHACRS